MFTYLAYTFSFIFSNIGGIIAWKSFVFFTPKSEFYRKSNYQIIYKKIFWVLSVMITIGLITLSFFGYIKIKF